MLGAIITRLKLVIAPLLLAVVILLLAACGDSQTADTPTPEAKVAAKAIAQPTSTQEPPKPEPSADTSTPVAKVETKPSGAGFTYHGLVIIGKREPNGGQLWRSKHIPA